MPLPCPSLSYLYVLWQKFDFRTRCFVRRDIFRYREMRRVEIATLSSDQGNDLLMSDSGAHLWAIGCSVTIHCTLQELALRFRKRTNNTQSCSTNKQLDE